MQSTALGSQDFAKDVLSIDGVYYALLENGGASFRLGSRASNWREALPPLGVNPTEEGLKALEQQGIFLGRASTTKPLALMCQGMGALWPGVGRELYEEFPVAREAMDRLASYASWDVLHLLEEADPTKINATRWQIPYLFLLEYAQWSYLSALGLKPNMFCGHSLGELIALCCSGIYSPELAWHILDTRAEHVASLEARAGQDFGMLAVHAKHDLVHELLQNYQSVRVANYNTPTQFILGGPKDVLKEIRSSLRKKRIPAVSLSVSLLFHHPKMRILREHSLMRLMALDMQPAATPVLSVCKGVPYPADTPSICTFIADLDENPVRFSECLTKMWQDYGLRTFLEIGPQEVLCGLIVENLPQAQVLSCGRKGHEARGLRELCAKLYALGYLPKSKLVQVQARPKEKIWGEDTLLEDTLLKDKPKAKEQSAKNLPENMDDEAKKLFELLARLSNLPPAAIALELDLRSDLALRSSSFPLLLSEAEKIFNKIPDFEELVQISTVGDLLRLFRGEKLAKEPKEIKVPLPRPAKLCCLEVIEQQVKLVAILGERPPKTPLGSLALGFLPLNQEDYKFLPSLLPDLFLGLPGLISELRLPLELLSYFEDTVGAKLPIKTVKDSGFLASDLAEEGANLPDRATERNFLKEAEIIVLLDLDPAKRLFADFKPWLEDLAARRKIILVRVWSKGYEPEQVLELCQNLNRPWLNSALALSLTDYVLPAWRRSFFALAPLLVRALSSAARQVLWLPVKQAYTLLAKTQGSELPYLPPSSAPAWTPRHCPALVPCRQDLKNMLPLGLRARLYFSASRDLTLCDLNTLPYVRGLEACCELALELAPWLELSALSDWSFGTFPNLYPGMVREGLLKVQAASFVQLKGVETRQIHSELEFKTVKGGRTDGGRRTVAKGCLVLSSEPHPHTDFAWEQDAYSIKQNGKNAADEILPKFYAAHKLPPIWQVLSSVKSCSSECLVCLLKLPCPLVSCIAQQKEKAYLEALNFFEGCVQAALLHLALGELSDTPSGECPINLAPDFLAKPYRLTSVGLFTLRPDLGISSCELLLYRTWQDKGFARYDAKVSSLEGETLLTVSQLEFEHASLPRQHDLLPVD